MVFIKTKQKFDVICEVKYTELNPQTLNQEITKVIVIN